MAHYYATIQGSAGKTSRCGTKNSGMKANVMSWQGQVTIELWNKEGIDYAFVSLSPHNGRGQSKVLNSGALENNSNNNENNT